MMIALFLCCEALGCCWEGRLLDWASPLPLEWLLLTQ